MWQELYKMVYSYLYNLGLGHEDAEDVAQETLTAVYLHLDGVQEGKLKHGAGIKVLSSCCKIR